MSNFIKKHNNYNYYSNLTKKKKANILVVIANYGEKNKIFIEKIINKYQGMKNYDVDLFVLSNTPKYFGPKVDVRIGIPINNPWSLPFGYKNLFLDKMESYDFFIYSEDDILIEEKNIDAFYEETLILPDQFITGFIRFEISLANKIFYPDMHSHYFWDPNSIIRFKNSLFAYHTNEHSGCFILTRNQLRKSIKSNGFMLPPRRGTYDMLVTAATEPYNECGMTKIICVSKIDDFKLHHLSNAYLGKLGLDSSCFSCELERIFLIASKKSSFLLGPFLKKSYLKDGDEWVKIYYEGLRYDILKSIPKFSKKILSIGCGSGITEQEIMKFGIEVTAIPLNLIVSSLAEIQGITMLSPDLDHAANDLKGQQFDCIIILDILPQIDNPVLLLTKYHEFLRDGGIILISVSNWNFFRTIIKRVFFLRSNNLYVDPVAGKKVVHRTTFKYVFNWLKFSGFKEIKNNSTVSIKSKKISKYTFKLIDNLLCRKLVVSAKRI